MNPQTYTPEKYGQPSGFPAQCDKLSQEDLAILDALVMGLHHADASLGLLTLQRAGIPLNQYFSWLDREVASHMLLSRRTLFVDQDGKGTYSPSQEDLAILEQYTAVERNLLYRR